MTEAEAKKIGGKQGVILMSAFLIIGVIWHFAYLLYELYDRGITYHLTYLKQSIEHRGHMFFYKGLWTLFELLLYGVVLIFTGYYMGRRAGFSIIIKSRNYLGIGYWTMLKIVIVYTIIFAFIFNIFNYPGSNNPILNVLEHMVDSAPYYIFFIIIYGLPFSLLGFWLGNKIDNERIKHLSLENEKAIQLEDD